MHFEDICRSFSECSQVEAIALGGSRAGTYYDDRSDYDLYVYCSEVPAESVRCGILQPNCASMEIGNHFWELEDDCVLKDGIPIDILYRNLEAFHRDVASVVLEHRAHNGYTTCMWHNLLHSKILFDRNGRFAQLQRDFCVEYPEQLRKNIVENNLRLLTGNLPSYDAQIGKAIKRKDAVSVNHRTAAFLESYFDILYALNRMTHPGEKRMTEYLRAQAGCLPVDFEENINRLLSSLFSAPEAVPEILSGIIDNLMEIIPGNLLETGNGQCTDGE